MTATPSVPRSVSFSVEVPGTPEQVWAAIATGPGLSSWFLPTEVEERVGGAVLTHMGETDVPGEVTVWEPPRRLAYQEPEWAGLVGQDPATTTPLVTEFVVEAQSGGSCVVHVVTSAFGIGAAWEEEFLTDMAASWRPYFDRLALYLQHFPGQSAATMEVEVVRPTQPEALRDVVLAAFPQVGQDAELRGVVGVVEVRTDDSAFMRMTAPVDGFLSVGVWGVGEGRAAATLRAQVFGEGARRWVEAEEAGWREWLEALVSRQPAHTPL